jgi:hypothetical protein
VKINHFDPSGNESDNEFPELSASTSGIILPQTYEPSLSEQNIIQQSMISDTGEASTTEKLMYIILGGLLSVGEKLNNNLEKFDGESIHYNSADQVLSYHQDDESQLKYALIGLAVKTPAILEKGAGRIGKIVDASYNFARHLLRPISSNRFMGPVHQKYEEMIQRGDQVINELIDTGRRGEVSSQIYARNVLNNLLEDVVNGLSKRPEIRELVQQQSYGMAQEISDEFQDRAAAADSIVERIVFKLIPGEKKDTTPVVILPIMEKDFEALNKVLDRKKP